MIISWLLPNLWYRLSADSRATRIVFFIFALNGHFFQKMPKWNGKWTLLVILLWHVKDSSTLVVFQSHLIVLIGLLIGYIFKVSWLFTFSKSADWLHFQSQLMSWRYKFLNEMISQINMIFKPERNWCFCKDFVSRQKKGQQFKSLEVQEANSSHLKIQYRVNWSIFDCKASGSD